MALKVYKLISDLPSSMWKEKEPFNPFELDPPGLVPPSEILEENTYQPPTPPSSGEEEEDTKKEVNIDLFT